MQSLDRLRDAAKTGISSLEFQCRQEQALYDGHYQWDTETRYSGPLSIPKDYYSESLLPEELQAIYSPLQSGADGNCLFRYYL